MIGLTADAGDSFKKRAAIPLAPCISKRQPGCKVFLMFRSQSLRHVDAVLGIVVEVDKLPGK